MAHHISTSGINFKGALERATADEVRAALDRTRGKPGNTTRTKILERRLRKLERQVQ